MTDNGNKREKRTDELNDKQKLAGKWAAIMLLQLFISCFVITIKWCTVYWFCLSIYHSIINLSIHLFGMAVGWVLGTFISPYTEDEKSDFQIYGKAFSVFVSGIFVAKVDDIVRLLGRQEFLQEPYGVFRIIVWFSSILVVAMFVFCFRRYDDTNKKEDSED